MPGSGLFFFFFFKAEDGIRDVAVTGVQTCALPISTPSCSTGDSPPLNRRRSDNGLLAASRGSARQRRCHSGPSPRRRVECPVAGATPALPSCPAGLLPVVRLLQALDVDLFHLQHGLHGPVRLLGIFVSQHPPQRGGNDLPRDR